MNPKEKVCSAKVWDEGGWNSYFCSKKPKIERDGELYCTIHDPEYIKKKNQKAQEKFDNDCCKSKKCSYHFDWGHYRFCPLCGTKR